MSEFALSANLQWASILWHNQTCRHCGDADVNWALPAIIRNHFTQRACHRRWNLESDNFSKQNVQISNVIMWVIYSFRAALYQRTHGPVPGVGTTGLDDKKKIPCSSTREDVAYLILKYCVNTAYLKYFGFCANERTNHTRISAVSVDLAFA